MSSTLEIMWWPLKYNILIFLGKTCLILIYVYESSTRQWQILKKKIGKRYFLEQIKN